MTDVLTGYRQMEHSYIYLVLLRELNNEMFFADVWHTAHFLLPSVLSHRLTNHHLSSTKQYFDLVLAIHELVVLPYFAKVHGWW